MTEYTEASPITVPWGNGRFGLPAPRWCLAPALTGTAPAHDGAVDAELVRLNEKSGQSEGRVRGRTHRLGKAALQ